MAIGGFNGNGGELSLAAVRSATSRAGDIHYYIAGGGAPAARAAARRSGELERDHELGRVALHARRRSAA